MIAVAADLFEQHPSEILNTFVDVSGTEQAT